MLFVSLCESEDFPDLRELARPPGAQKILSPLPLFSKMPPDLLIIIGVLTGRHIVEAGSRKGQKSVRHLFPYF